MPHSKSSLLTPVEKRDLYDMPVFSEIELQEYFTFNDIEMDLLRNFVDVKSAVYFAISLVFFKCKHTIISFQYQDVTVLRQYIMRRYFMGTASPRSQPSESTKKRINLKIMEICLAKRLADDVLKNVVKELQEFASHAPRQRQLLKELLRILSRRNIIIPKHTTLQDIVSEVWNLEHKRVLGIYMKQTTSNDRRVILTLLDKTTADTAPDILMMKTDLKSFNTQELRQEIEKHAHIKSIFVIAKNVLGKLNLPHSTCEYYASLIRYYHRPQMKRMNQIKMGLYLLCYAAIKYPIMNDTLIDAFKKRVSDYQNKSTDYIKEQQLEQLRSVKEMHKQLSCLMLMIDKSPAECIPKADMYKYISKEAWVDTALSLTDEKFDKKRLFWKYIDSLEDSIKLSIRALFIAIDFKQKEYDPLNIVVTFMRKQLEDKTFGAVPFPTNVIEWLTPKDRLYVMKDHSIIRNRFEFLVYRKIANAFASNNITLEATVRYKSVEDEIIDSRTWKNTKKPMLATLNYPKLIHRIKQTLASKNDGLTSLYKTVNAAIISGENQSVIIKKDKHGESTWRMHPIEAKIEDPNEGVFALVKQHSIVEVIKFVNERTNFIKAFEPLLPKSTQTLPTIEYVSAVTLANAIRIGVRKMANSSDLNESKLVTMEVNYIRTETLSTVIDIINNATAKFPIFDKWYLQSIVHGSLDALKLATTLAHHKGRHSSKYFGCGLGVASINEIVNGLSVTGRLIGAHEYEGGFNFEMCILQNTTEIKPTHISTDKHGMNMFNFALFDLIDMVFAPRIPKPHKEILWGFGKVEDYEGLLIKPTKFINEQLLIDEEDNIKRLMASFLTGHVSPSIIIQKMSAKEYTSKTKAALIQYNNLEKSKFILQTIHDPNLRYVITQMLNRGESYNNLYRAITLLNDGELRGKSDIEMELWNQCTRLIAAIIHYYNTYIINSLHERSNNDEEKKFLENLSPTAWTHVLLIGFFQFFSKQHEGWVEDFLRQWNWAEMSNRVSTKKK